MYLQHMGTAALTVLGTINDRHLALYMLIGQARDRSAWH
jgi:hypothetical protein